MRRKMESNAVTAISLGQNDTNVTTPCSFIMFHDVSRCFTMFQNRCRAEPKAGLALFAGVACDYLLRIGMDRVEAYEQELSKYLWEAVPGVEQGAVGQLSVGTVAPVRLGLVSRNMAKLH